jgi:excisionase family DNA binding protein
MNDEPRHDYKQLAERLNCKPSTIRRWTSQGCPHRKFGRLTRYEEGEVLAWLETRARKKAEEKKVT